MADALKSSEPGSVSTGRAAPTILLQTDGGTGKASGPESGSHVGSKLRRGAEPVARREGYGHGLPIQVTSFVGRQSELARVHDLVSRTRVVTLAGPGGAGKTRLAFEAAAQLADGFPDGVVLVELAALTDPALVPDQVAAALHRPELNVGELRDQRLLLVLDNCEHLIDECAELVESIVRACPEIAVLATSREPLSIPARLQSVSHLWILPMRPSSSERGRCSLVPELQLPERSSATVEAICRRLDGMPLAIELAAARTRAMTPVEILERLEDRFQLLTSGNRTADERHQTLYAAMAWSYELLDEPEKTLFRRLSIFTGGWSLESAEAICSATPDDLDVSDLLLRLVDKSLVQVDGDERSRYRMLTTLRQYGREQLVAAGEHEALESRHGEHFLGLTRSSGWPTESWWLDPRVLGVALDLDNFRAALEWSRSRGPEIQLRLVIGMAPLWMAQGRFAEGRTALAEALQRSPEPSMLRLRALEQMGWLAVEQGDTDSGAAAAKEMLELAQEHGGHGRAEALSIMGFGALKHGDHTLAAELLDSSLAGYQAAGNTVGIAQVRHHQGALASMQGDIPTAEALFDEVISIASHTGDDGLVTYALLSLIPALVDAGMTAQARSRWDEAYRRSGSGDLTVLNLALLGFAAATSAAEGRVRRAVALTQVALGLQMETGWQDDELLNWFWRTLAPAFAALDEEGLAEAQAVGDRMTVEAALRYAVTDDD